MDTLPPARQHVLVVDDDRDNADALALVLRLEGYEATVAYDGPAALALVAADPPAAALLDIAMPGMDGCEVARRLRRLPGIGGRCSSRSPAAGRRESSAAATGRASTCTCSSPATPKNYARFSTGDSQPSRPPSRPRTRGPGEGPPAPTEPVRAGRSRSRGRVVEPVAGRQGAA
jgi:CheY-like chemotaxis protein